ncbi:MAG: ATP-dependent 6-phosphofructokinase [Candidatus Omnitrophica bacterium]|nr:ATP-dependent 6-phosphofructokinase [Candidatus Omnitrophota bacterium]
MERIGILTGGGDCPGINPVIRGVVRAALKSNNYELIGLLNGWQGLLNKDSINLDLNTVSGIVNRGGTILGTSRTNPYKIEGGSEKCIKNFKSLNLDALVAIGGEDTLGVATKLHKEGLNIVGVPKTIDNDLSATDFTFGFDTAVNVATEAIDRLHTTAESHHRIMVAEVMGRHAGWIAVYAGIAGGADVILIPEIPIDLNEVVEILKNRKKRGKNFSIVVVAEGAKFKDDSLVIQEEKLDSFGHVRLGGIGQILSDKIEKMTGFETRVTVLGHIQRGGSPTAYDRVLGTRFGVAAVKLIEKKKFGRMVSLSGNEIIDVPLEKAVGKLKTVDMNLYDVAKIFFG